MRIFDDFDVKKKDRRVTGLTACMLILLAVLLLAPVVFMNHESDAVSTSENRRLQAFPVLDLEALETDDGVEVFFSDLSAYVSDRIGFREEMVGLYSALNDSLFGVMTHPLYEYGDDGYVFFRFSDAKLNEDYLVAFADYVAKMQDYCEVRGVRFLYAISPEKARIYADRIPSYVSSDMSFSSDLLIPLLDERGVNYVDQGDALLEAKEAGKQVFNVAYDAGHWNSEGMYAGSQAIIESLQSLGVPVEDIDLSAYWRDYEEQTSLPASNYPIRETTYKYRISVDAVNAAREDEAFNNGLVLDDSFRTTHYFTSAQDQDCSVLMFQGSYYNTQGTMLQNQFSTLATVHDYENVFNLPYYIDVYDPDVVVFENADYTVSNAYYSYEALLSTDLPSPFADYDDWDVVEVNLGLEFDPDRESSVASFYFAWPEEAGDVDRSYVIAGDVVYEAALQEDGRYLWGCLSGCLESVESVTVVGVDVEGKLKYQGAAAVLS